MLAYNVVTKRIQVLQLIIRQEKNSSFLNLFKNKRCVNKQENKLVPLVVHSPFNLVQQKSYAMYLFIDLPCLEGHVIEVILSSLNTLSRS